MHDDRLKFLGKWVSSMPHDSDDYRVEYQIRYTDKGFDISAKDLQDDEEMEITDISWENGGITFKSFMPSTGRSGINYFRINSQGNIESKFTFTVLEELKRMS